MMNKKAFYPVFASFLLLVTSCGKDPVAPAVPEGVVTLDKTNFASMTRVAGRVSMVEFYSPASLACQALDSSVEGIARRYGGKAVIAKVNFSQDDALKAEWDVWILPTFLFLNGGREVKRIVQPSGGDSLVMVLDSLLAPGSK